MKSICKIFLTAVLVIIGYSLLSPGIADASNTCVTPPSNMVSWWPGDGNFNDIVGSNNLTPSGGITFGPGEVGQAFLLDGVSGKADAGNAPSLQVSSGNFSVDAWVNFNALSHPPGSNNGRPAGDMSIVDKISNSGADNSDGWRLLKQDDNHFWFCFGGIGGNGCYPGSPNTVRSVTVATTGTWYHVAAVKNSSTIAIYVNGILEDSKPLAPFTDTNATDLLIGANIQYGAHFNGLIDEVELFNKALSPSEILSMYNAGSAGKCKTQNVTIEVKPGSDQPAPVNPNSKGKIPVAILSTSTFDATTVDPTTVKFGATGTEALPTQNSLQDVNGDGLTDMLLQFNTLDTGIVCGTTSVTLTGKTTGGQMISGTLPIKTVGCH